MSHKSVLVPFDRYQSLLACEKKSFALRKTPPPSPEINRASTPEHSADGSTAPSPLQADASSQPPITGDNTVAHSETPPAATALGTEKVDAVDQGEQSPPQTGAGESSDSAGWEINSELATDLLRPPGIPAKRWLSWT